jgi:hypothetical protein
MVGPSVSDSQEFLAIEVSNESSASLRLIEVLLELGVLGLEQHGDLLGLLVLEVCLLLGAIRSGMAGLVTDRALDSDCALWLEGTGPGTMAFLLAIVAVVVVDTLNLQVVAVQQVLQLLVLLSVENLLDFIYSLLQLLIIISHNHYMQWLIVFEDILGSLICPSASHSYLAS